MPNETEELESVASDEERGMLSEPNLDDVVQARWCRHCHTAVVPIEKGRCPMCKRFTPGNVSRVKDHVRTQRLHDIFRQLVADFVPSNEVERSQVQALARVCERLERCRPGNLEHVRLVKAQRELIESLNQGLRQRRFRQEVNR